jgi:mono/diheme cytochrome c family protein
LDVVPRRERHRCDKLAAGGAEAGRTIFATAGCGACHSLEAADADGSSGPDLDETKPDAALVRDVVTNGKGAMPAFGDDLTDREIESLANFVSASAGGR